MVGLHLLKMVWSRLEGAWRGWRAKLVTWRRNRLQRRFVEEGEEIDFCSICHAEYAAGEEVFIILVNQVKLSFQLMYPGCHPSHAGHADCLNLWFEMSLLTHSCNVTHSLEI